MCILFYILNVWLFLGHILYVLNVDGKICELVRAFVGEMFDLK